MEFTCDTLREGYRRKLSYIRLGTAQEYLRLGEWCQRHGLIDEAEQELAKAAAIEPDHPLIPVLRRRLEIARHPPQPQPAPAAASKRAISAEELDRLVRTMPPGTVETFTQSIQPLLVNHCTGAGCHGPQSTTDFRLLKTPSSRPAARRLTQRNLYATLQLVDRAKPEASPLLTAPIQPHGTAKAAIFSQNQAEQYRRIAGWVFRFAQGPKTSLPARVDPPNQHGSSASPAIAASVGAPTPASRVLQAAALEPGPCPFDGPETGPVDDDQRRLSDPERDRYEAPHRSQPKRGDPSPGFEPADPFDPEIFNRRHHAAR